VKNSNLTNTVGIAKVAHVFLGITVLKAVHGHG